MQQSRRPGEPEEGGHEQEDEELEAVAPRERPRSIQRLGRTEPVDHDGAIAEREPDADVDHRRHDEQEREDARYDQDRVLLRVHPVRNARRRERGDQGHGQDAEAHDAAEELPEEQAAEIGAPLNSVPMSACPAITRSRCVRR
jgi:hypothetical protein